MTRLWEDDSRAFKAKRNRSKAGATKELTGAPVGRSIALSGAGKQAQGGNMAEIYSVVAAFGTTADAEGAVQKLERSGLPKGVMSIEDRVSPIQQQTTDVSVSLEEASIGSWAITGALLGGFWGVLVNGDRLQNEKGDVLPIEPLLSCLGFAVKGACVFAGISLVSLSMNGEIPRLQLMHDEPTLAIDPYLLVVHGTPAAVMLAGDILRAA